jgi:hypothetical protein
VLRQENGGGKGTIDADQTIAARVGRGCGARMHIRFAADYRLERAMISWLVRGVLIVSGAVTGWFVSKDAANFSLIQGMAALLVVVLAVFVLAFWPARWSHLLNRRGR